jgi:glutamate transport system permease protein
MSTREATVLYDAPGPKAIRRYRIYTVITAVVLLGLLALFVRQMQSTGQFAYEKWEYFVTPKYLQTILVDGILNTVKAAAVAILLALAIGMVFGTAKLSENPWVRWPAWVFVEFFRAVPLLLLIIFIYFGYFSGKDYGSPIYALIIGLALYNGAVLAEIVRAGVLALPRGQSEAAYAIGMTRGQVTRIVLLPQAVKIMIPAMISQFVVCLKDTSLGYAINALGITFVFKLIWGEGRNQVQAIIVMSAIYILLNLGVTAIATWAQRRYVGEGRGAATAADEAV